MMHTRNLAYWLIACCFMVFAMAVIGAITRLTESGLSITVWEPVTGALPPLNEAAWQKAFDAYRQTPEFLHQHSWMGLEDYKKIYFWEWLHRLWGRLIGAVYALPMIWFWVRGQIPSAYKKPLLGLLALGGLQGFIGWFMVQSGLIDRPDVSHYRLALHLSMAFIIFGWMVWLAVPLWRGETAQVKRARPHAFTHGIAGLCALSLTIIWGAFTAGLDAGMIYNSFPLMNGHLLPQESIHLLSPLEQQAWVQFTHRWLAVLTGVLLLSYAWRTRFYVLGAMVFVQIGLGIVTLLSQVEITPATLHQAGALILLGLVIYSFKRGKTP